MGRKRQLFAWAAVALPVLAATAHGHPGHGAPVVHVHPPGGLEQTIAACVLAIAVAMLLTRATRAAVRAGSRRRRTRSC